MIAVASLGTGNFNKIVCPPYVCANAPLTLVNVSESGWVCTASGCPVPPSQVHRKFIIWLVGSPLNLDVVVLVEGWLVGLVSYGSDGGSW